MIISIYGNTIGPEHKENLEDLFNQLAIYSAEIIIYEPFFKHLAKDFNLKPKVKALFSTSNEVIGVSAIMLSIGGDGAFLASTTFVRDSGIPIAGINFGRLGFLANITSTNLKQEIGLLCKGNYTVEQRSLLGVSLPHPFEDDFPYALNELAIQKDGASMVTIEAYINNERLCTYWSDGLIIATPTGSTAYSLSVGGPIVSPQSNTFTISAIAPHLLTVRPLVIPDSSLLTLVATARSNSILVSIDSRTYTLPKSISLTLSKAPFHVGVINLEGTTYYKTLRNKLMWGLDYRNNI